MQDYRDFQEIENWGEEPEAAEEIERSSESGGYAGGILPILQVILCVAALLSLAVLKATDAETYHKAVSWYQSEAAKEIELPQWRKNEPEVPSSSDSIAAELSDTGIFQQI